MSGTIEIRGQGSYRVVKDFQLFECVVVENTQFVVGEALSLDYNIGHIAS